jgi:RNA polymerase sigma-70 factor (ECF subfamily)
MQPTKATKATKAMPMADHETLDDSTLVAAVCDGDGDELALAEIYQRHAGAVWAIARHICRRHELAEEVCQVVFTDLWARPGRYDRARGDLRAWLVSQARGRAVDAVRAEEARRRREAHHSRLLRRDDGHEAPDATVDAAHVADRVHRALGQLPEPQRQAILLTYFAGHTHREAAGLLDAPPGTIKSRIRLGLGTLRHRLAAEGTTP